MYFELQVHVYIHLLYIDIHAYAKCCKGLGENASQPFSRKHLSARKQISNQLLTEFPCSYRQVLRPRNVSDEAAADFAPTSICTAHVFFCV